MSVTPNLPHTSLPTEFTPAPSCLTQFWAPNGPTGLVQLGPLSTDAVDCLPVGWATNSQYFSPAICPVGYTSACWSTTIIGSATETQATCCPTGFACQSEAAEFASLIHFYTIYQCTRTNLSFTPRSFYVTEIINRTATDATPTTNVQFTTLPDSGGVNAYGISIRYQASDLARLNAMATSTTESTASLGASSASTGSATSHNNGESLASTGSATSHNNGESSSSKGLTSGAKVGIGVAVGIACLVILASIVLLLHSRSRRRQQPRVPNPPKAVRSPEILKYELPGNPLPPEALRYELPGNPRPPEVLQYELPGNP